MLSIFSGISPVLCLTLVILATSLNLYTVETHYPWITWNKDYKQEMQQKCTDDLPCYDITLNFIWDGACSVEFGPNPDAVIRHYRKAGLGIQDIIADGQRAAQIMKERTGFDFTDLPKMAYLNSDATALNGTVVFTPIVVQEKCKYRVTSVQNRNEVQLINKPVSDVAWLLRILAETRVHGTINRVLPPGANIGIGSYLIELCQQNDKECKSILFPKDPQKPIFIKYITKEFLGVYQSGSFGQIDCILENEEWGKGIGRGIAFTGTAERPNIDFINVLRFPFPLTSLG